MPCHTVEFTLSVLGDKPYSDRLSGYITAQILELDCDDFARLIRALDAVECGEPVEKFPGDFCSSGVLAGYGHLHYRRPEWAGSNLALSQKMPVSQQLDETIDKVADSIVESGSPIEQAIADAMDKFASRVMTGDWVIYRKGPDGFEYLMLSEHVDRGSVEEQQLSETLAGIIRGEQVTPYDSSSP